MEKWAIEGATQIIENQKCLKIYFQCKMKDIISLSSYFGKLFERDAESEEVKITVFGKRSRMTLRLKIGTNMGSWALFITMC